MGTILRFCAFYLFAGPAFAVYSLSGYMQAFDFDNCLIWNIHSELPFAESGMEPPALKAAQALANLPMNMYFGIHTAFALNKPDESIEKYGVCKYKTETRGSDEITCLPGLDFPLSGATYSQIRSKGQLPSLKCVSGCRGVPSFVYDLGYENMNGERNIELEAAERKFRKHCGGAP